MEQINCADKKENIPDKQPYCGGSRAIFCKGKTAAVKLMASQQIDGYGSDENS
jgi:hypothetical protein